jgi:hypothetical protein
LPQHPLLHLPQHPLLHLPQHFASLLLAFTTNSSLNGGWLTPNVMAGVRVQSVPPHHLIREACGVLR